MKAAIYLRVSNIEQTTMNQRLELQEVCRQRGWEAAGIYEDHGISGAKGRDQRPAFDKLQRDATRGQFDIVLAWSVDRLGRSLRDLVNFLEEIQSVKIALYLHKQGLDTSTPAGQAMFQMLGIFAQFERAIMQERIHAGLKRARFQGKKLGRPMVSTALEQAIRASLVAGLGINECARKHRVGVATVSRVRDRSPAE